ncbi:serine/threonine protein kinase [Actinomadura sp. KC345]|uniref:serine/threonine-protein kinase n=1 Tax=Actinomadura sp. KC345 TaxID=2530371 RepID=UPI0010445C04|nr:serine/threonine-protein kinase [Actinomadura sp. KC345]TDC46841.1 serine/threonine protein kinase [Actinomadura sp. KC345]
MSFPPSVGRYRIDRVLGSGAFAAVWLGHDDALDSQVAIKVLSGSLIDDLDVRNRFLEEARILRRADSERLVRVHDIGELPDGRPYFVMSYADRGTLADRMRERPLPVNEAIALAEEIAHGVEVINTLGVIHRDLKPTNVLFQSTPDGGEKVLIADLGLAKALAHASGAFTLPVGTPGYMSPEQARFGGGLDVRADVYGLGALTYHMVAGKAPGPAPVKSAPSALREGVSPAFDQVILRALEVEREKRWPTAEAFAEALSTLRPTSAPGAAAAAYAPPAPPINADATVQDYYQDGAQAPPPGSGRPPGHGQAVTPVQGQAPGPGPAQHSVQGQGPPPAQGPWQGGQPGEDGIGTSAMRVPPAPQDEGERTVVDGASGRGTPFGQVEGPTAPDNDNDRTVSMQSSHQAPPPPPGGQGGDGDKTAVLPAGAPQNGAPPVGPQGGAMQPPMGQGAGGSPPFGQPGQPGQPGPPGQPSQPPTGFQPPPPGQAQGQGQGPGGGQGGGGARKKFVTPLLITAVVLVVALIGGLTLGLLFSGDDEGKEEKTPQVPKDFAAVSDNAGKIKTAVPKAWPKDPEQTWTPSAVNLNDGQPRPVLRATPDKAAFLGDGEGPGVFIGVTTDVRQGQLPPPTAAVHSQCTKAAPENYTTPDKALSGTITRFTNCKSGTPSVTEVGLKDRSGKFGLWIRVKETDNRNATKDILDNLKVTGP